MKDEEYQAMVKDLAKPGENILRTLSTKNVHLLHMLIGLVGETRELHDGLVAGDWENTKEELGDLEFYLVGFALGFPTYVRVPITEPDLRLGWTDLYRAVDDLVDLTKKLVIYNKDVSDKQFHHALQRIHYNLASCYIGVNTTREITLEANRKKLLTGKNARYKAGKYSDDQAIARADKQGVGDGD